MSCLNILRARSLSARLSWNALRVGSLLATPPVSCSIAARCLHYMPIETSNKIEVGHKMTQVIEKHLVKLRTDAQHKFKLRNSASKTLLISSSTPSKNHYVGQKYAKFIEMEHMCSYSWANRTSVGKFFTINPTGAHPAKMVGERSHLQFDDTGLSGELVRRLASALNVRKPTNVQCTSIEHILQRTSHLLVNAETGSGKSLGIRL